jgi:hypothetical protein
MQGNAPQDSLSASSNRLLYALMVIAAKMRIVLILAVSGLLASCAEHRVATRAPGVNLSGFSAEFKRGYADGCASISGPMQRDESRYKADGQYARGWRDGFSICKH